MHNLSTTYFDGVHFVCSGYWPAHPDLMINRFKDYYGIQYSQDGRFRVEIDGSYRRTVSGPWVLLTRPGPLFRYGALPGKCRLHAFLCFKGPRVETYIRTGLLPMDSAHPLIRITQPERFLSRLRQVIFLTTPFRASCYAQAVHGLEDLLLQLQEQAAAKTAFPEHRREELARLARQILRHPMDPWGFPAVAHALHLSYHHFRRLFRIHCGLPPTQFLLRARLNRAAAQLIGTEMPIQRIAEQCGFVNSFYFSRIFKKYYRLSPFQYRKGFSSGSDLTPPAAPSGLQGPP